MLTIIPRSSKHCTECNTSYSNERSHRAVCARKQVSCVYPNPNSDEGGLAITLHRVNGYFKCIRCEKEIKKDQNMKVCHFHQNLILHLMTTRSMLVNVTASPA